MNESSFILANETWFKRRDPQLKTYLQEIDDESSIKCIRKDRKLSRSGLAHGGVALFYDSDRCSFSKFNLNALRGDTVRDYEILACRGQLRGVKREIIAFSCYLPPKIPKKELENILETLTDAISEARAKSDSPWIVIGGDWNRYDVSYITTMYPDLIKIHTEPTRKEATLDYVFTNFNHSVLSADVFPN